MIDVEGSESEFKTRWTENKVAIRPEFYVKAVEDREASASAGRVIFKNQHWVWIHKQGALGHTIPYSIKDAKSIPAIWGRIKKEYQSWVEGSDAPLEGAALASWPLISPAQLRNLQGMHVHTVEELAQLPDSSLSFIGGKAVDLRNRARAWVSGGEREVSAMRTADIENENAALRAELDKMKEQMAELIAASRQGQKGRQPASA